MGHGQTVLGRLRALDLEVWPAVKKDAMPFELRLPLEVETRVTDLEFRGLRLR
jgi:hypothetical protein